MSLYFLAFIPPEIIQQEVKILKEEIRLKYAAKHAIKLPAHITLLPPFKLSEENKVPFLKVLSNFSETEQPLEINLNGFGSFLPRVVFIDVLNKEPLRAFHHRLQDALSKVPNFPHIDKRALHPHITLATRDLNKDHFRMAWKDFQGRKYTAGFTACSLTLLRHNGKIWEIYSEFNLAKERGGS
jgi:2'-5' RNA ligase